MDKFDQQTLIITATGIAVALFVGVHDIVEHARVAPDCVDDSMSGSKQITRYETTDGDFLEVGGPFGPMTFGAPKMPSGVKMKSTFDVCLDPLASFEKMASTSVCPGFESKLGLPPGACTPANIVSIWSRPVPTEECSSGRKAIVTGKFAGDWIGD